MATESPLFKVTHAGFAHQACVEGTWAPVGSWSYPQPPVPGRSGYHLCRAAALPGVLGPRNPVIVECEIRGARVELDGLVVAEEARIVRALRIDWHAVERHVFKHLGHLDDFDPSLDGELLVEGWENPAGLKVVLERLKTTSDPLERCLLGLRAGELAHFDPDPDEDDNLSPEQRRAQARAWIAEERARMVAFLLSPAAELQPEPDLPDGAPPQAAPASKPPPEARPVDPPFDTPLDDEIVMLCDTCGTFYASEAVALPLRVASFCPECGHFQADRVAMMKKFHAFGWLAGAIVAIVVACFLTFVELVRAFGRGSLSEYTHWPFMWIAIAAAIGLLSHRSKLVARYDPNADALSRTGKRWKKIRRISREEWLRKA